MQPLRIKGTAFAPSVVLDKETNEFVIKGGGFYNYDFFDPIFEWIDTYIQDPNNLTIVVFKLNTPSTGHLQFYLRIIRKFEELYKQEHLVEIHWYYPEGDLDAEEDSIDISMEFDLPFIIESF